MHSLETCGATEGLHLVSFLCLHVGVEVKRLSNGPMYVNSSLSSIGN